MHDRQSGPWNQAVYIHGTRFSQDLLYLARSKIAVFDSFSGKFQMGAPNFSNFCVIWADQERSSDRTMPRCSPLAWLPWKPSLLHNTQFWTSFQKKFAWIDSEKGNRVFTIGAHCAPSPLPHGVKKSLSWIGLTYPRQAFLCSKKKPRVGGGGLAPPSKNPVTLLRIHSSKSFESLSKYESLDTTLVSMETMVSVLRWFIVFRYLTGNPF